MRQVVLAQRHLDLHTRVGVVAQHFDDPGNCRAMLVGIGNDLQHHHLAMTGTAVPFRLQQ
ncbi:hypothetical protein D3C85_1611430 [compost metagenome]